MVTDMELKREGMNVLLERSASSRRNASCPSFSAKNSITFNGGKGSGKGKP